MLELQVGAVPGELVAEQDRLDLDSVPRDDPAPRVGVGVVRVDRGDVQLALVAQLPVQRDAPLPQRIEGHAPALLRIVWLLLIWRMTSRTRSIIAMGVPMSRFLVADPKTAVQQPGHHHPVPCGVHRLKPQRPDANGTHPWISTPPPPGRCPKPTGPLLLLRRILCIDIFS
jgi:hypothetical protein